MKINNSSKRILCFGDSNTWGSIPGLSKRFPADIRWTGVLQQLLGDNYDIIEEGLSARTTDIDDLDHPEELRNGKKYLIPCLNSQIPLDLVVLFLGTNDFKSRYNRQPEDTAKSIEAMIELIGSMTYVHETIPPKVILICPALIDSNERDLFQKYEGAEAKSLKLSELLTELSKKLNLPFIDMTKEFRAVGHLNEEEHRKLAELIAEKIKSLNTILLS